MEGGIRKILTENVQNLASRIFGKITLNPLQFRKASSSARMTEQKQKLSRTPLTHLAFLDGAVYFSSQLFL